MMRRIVAVMLVVVWSSCRNESNPVPPSPPPPSQVEPPKPPPPPPAPAEQPEPPLPDVPPVVFGKAPLKAKTKFRDRWNNVFNVTTKTDRGNGPEDVVITDQQRGEAVVEVKAVDKDGQPTAIAVNYAEVERLSGPASQKPEADPIAKKTFAIEKKGTGFAIKRGSAAASDEEVRSVHERFDSFYEVDPFLQALQAQPVRVGEKRLDLAAAFLDSFMKRESRKGGPPVQPDSAAVRLVEVKEDEATFQVAVNFAIADKDTMMKLRMQGTVTVHVPSAQFTEITLSGPVQMTSKGSAEVTEAQSSDTFTRERL